MLGAREERGCVGGDRRRGGSGKEETQHAGLLTRKPMTAEEFLYAYEGVEGRWELVHGEPRMMSGGTIRHGDVAANIVAVLRAGLRGQGCKGYGSDVGIRVDLDQIRYPDASVLCDPRDIGADTLKVTQFPSLLFEVLSPSTRNDDFGTKLPEYKLIETTKMIVIVDPEAETAKVFERIGAADWREGTIERGDDVPLPIGLTLTAFDIFRRD